ncbi:MAG: type II secretory pathway pseudopilin PulG [Gammaproteobacteria bacterium]
MRSLPRTTGFTLIEALVAVTLLALLFGALMPVFQQGLSLLRSADRHTRAVLLAQSILDRQLALSNAQDESTAQTQTLALALAQETQGDIDDYSWQITRQPFVVEDGQLLNATTLSDPATEREPGPFKLTEISVVVRWPGNPSGVQLHTLVLEAAQ